MYALTTINPFLAARFSPRSRSGVAGKRIAARPQPEQHPEPEQPVYAKLPRAPRNASPVPHLTSLYHHAEPGPYGDRGYPGNCGGNLIRDLLRYFKPDGLVFDPLCGAPHNGSNQRHFLRPIPRGAVTS